MEFSALSEDLVIHILMACDIVTIMRFEQVSFSNMAQIVYTQNIDCEDQQVYQNSGRNPTVVVDSDKRTRFRPRPCSFAT